MAAAAERTVTAAPGTPEHGSLGPRSRITPERETELYRAVLDLLREVGYDALTMDAIASRTRSSKATLYRQWKGKPQLVATALRRSKPVSVGELDTGSLRGDFQTLVTRL
ncbi:TetR/AcrR family transcriptional regulator, partial [Streptomyces sp. NPDC087850]